MLIFPTGLVCFSMLLNIDVCNGRVVLVGYEGSRDGSKFCFYLLMSLILCELVFLLRRYCVFPITVVIRALRVNLKLNHHGDACV